MRDFSLRKHTMFWVRLFTAVLFLMLLLLFLWKYRNGLYTDPVLSLRINEVCTINPGTQEGGSTTYEDYIELYNPSDETVSLEGLYLSDDPADPLLSALPADTLGPGQYYLIYAAGEGDSAPADCPYVSFGLTEEETILLTWVNETEDGVVSAHTIDSVYVPSGITSGAVYAASEDGGAEFAEARPSPGASNSAAPLTVDEPVFLTPGGFYEDSAEVVLSAAEGLTIRYTLDGSEPTEDSFLYVEPLVLTDPSSSENVYSAREDITSLDRKYQAPEGPVDKAAVVRAAAFDGDGNRSNTVTSTYFIDFGEKEGYEDAVILSLVTDPEGLFSDEMGIYVRGSLYEDALDAGEIYEEFPWIELMDYTQYYWEGMESERPAHLELYSVYGDALLDQSCGIRIRGNESRSFPQKSFTLYSRKRYEKEAFDPVLFDSGISYPSLILNNSKTLKKVFFFSLVEDRGAAVQRYIPCQVFLNGEYWGMYYLMERYSSEYLDGYYGADEETSTLIKDTRYVADGDPEGIESYRALRDYLDREDLDDPEVYAGLLAQMDMQSFIDWMCTNIYIANTDSKPLENNVYTWQSGLAAPGAEAGSLAYSDGKWRWMLYDLDDSLAVGTSMENGETYTMDSFTDHAGYAPSGYLDDKPMAALMKNADFRRQFVLTFLDMANENFRAERILSLLDEIEAEYTAWADASWERWNANPQDKPFAEQVEELRVFFENRFDYIVPCLAEHFGLTGSLATLSLSADTGEGDPDGASIPISLNTLSLELDGAESWQGQYYTDYPVTLTAQEADGLEFVRWEVDGGTITEGSVSTPSIQVQLNGDTRIRAVYE